MKTLMDIMKSSMASLYESLLDDFEDIESSQNLELINKYLEDLDVCAKSNPKYSHGSNYPSNVEKYDNGIKTKGSRIDGNELILDLIKSTNRYMESFIINDTSIKIIEQLKALSDLDNITISGSNSICFDGTKLDNSIINDIKIYNGSFMLGNRVSEISNLNIKLPINSISYPPAAIYPSLRSYSYMDLKFNNCHITHELSDDLKNNCIFTSSIPSFNNCKMRGFEGIFIYDALGVRDAENADFKNLFDETYKTNFIINGKKTTRKATLKNICAFINNPKKYNPSNFIPENENDSIFKINQNFKLSDFINIKCFDNKLKYIEIADNNVGILFFKKNTTLKNLHFKTISRLNIFREPTTYNMVELPNDKDWFVAVLKCT